MDVKQRMDFLNVVSKSNENESVLTCKECNTNIGSDDCFCPSCGSPTDSKSANIKGNDVKVQGGYYEEPITVFAEGLPEWDIVPPHLIVRRKKKI